MVTSKKLLYAALRHLDFVRTYRSQSDHNPHIYERRQRVDMADLVIDVQLWPDGRHRVSHMWSGYGVVKPTYFRTAAELPLAVEDQIKKARVTQDHVRKVRS